MGVKISEINDFYFTNELMLQSSIVLFFIGALGTCTSMLLLIFGVIKNNKTLKRLATVFTLIFLFIFVASIVSEFQNSEITHGGGNQVTNIQLNSESDKRISSGDAQDLIVITEKSFFDNDDMYIGEFEVVNNTDFEISKILLNITYTYNCIQGSGGSNNSVIFEVNIPPRGTTTFDYYKDKSDIEKKISLKNVKLIRIERPSCIININGEDQSLTYAELKSAIDNNE